MTRRALPRRWLWGLILGALGCGADFDPYNRLTSLRVLAVASDPPAPAPGETTTLTSLVFTPDPAEPVSYAWSWCPFPGEASQGYPCRITEADLANMMMTAGQAGAAVQIPPFDLGTGTTAMLPNTVSPTVLGALCAGVAGVPQRFDCEGGFPVQIKLTVRTAADEVITVRTVRLRFDPATEPNAPPHIDGLIALQWKWNGLVPTEELEQPLTDDPMITLARRTTTRLEAVVPEEVAETYTGKDGQGQPVAMRERVVLSWFVETGNTRDDRTGFIDGAVPWTVALENRWTPAAVKDYAVGTARLIVVIRDNRGGVAWRSAAVKLGEAP